MYSNKLIKNIVIQAKEKKSPKFKFKICIQKNWKSIAFKCWHNSVSTRESGKSNQSTNWIL